MEDVGCTFRFGPFTLEVREHRLLGPEGEIYLRPKTFETLRFLVERHGHLVTREILFDSVWTGVSVTDNALSRCIKEIRKALSDDANDPQFLKTIPRVGYTFVAQVDELCELRDQARTKALSSGGSELPADGSAQRSQNGEGERSVRAAATQGKTGTSVRGTRFRHRVIGAVAMIGIAAAAVSVLMRLQDSPAALGFRERDWVLISDLENLTSERSLEVAIRVALEQELSLSRYLNYVPPGRVVDTLQLMRLDVGTKLTEDVAREICLRDGGIRALIAGSVQQSGRSFQIALKLVDPSTGGAVRILIGDAEDRDHVLASVARLAGRLRETLGESIESIATSQRELERVTTPSLPALEAYSRGERLFEGGAFEQAAALLDRAIELDPGFASAYWLRARNRNISGGDWENDFRNATKLADKVTDRERLLILVTDAAFVQHDLVKALQLSEIMTREFPDDYSGRMICSYLRLAAGDLEGWKREVEEMLRARPNDAFAHFWKGLVLLLVTGELERAEVEARRVLEINPAFPAGFPYFCRASASWIRGDSTAAGNRFHLLLERDMHKLGPVFQFTVRGFIARFFFFLNETDLAFRLTETSEWMTPRAADSTIARGYQFENALMHCELGEADPCLSLLRERARSAVGLFRVETLGWLGIQLARMGETREAERVRNELSSESREVPVGFFTPPLPEERAKAQSLFASQILGEIALQSGDADGAVRYFEEVVARAPSHGSVFSSALGPRLYLVAQESLGRTYSTLGQDETSIQAYQSIIERKHLLVAAPAAGPIWTRAVRSIIPLLEARAQSGAAAKYRALLHE